jgi:hypothetical protein
MNLQAYTRSGKRARAELRALGTIEAWHREPSRRDWLWSAACWEAAARREAEEDQPNSAVRAADYHKRAELCVIIGESWPELEARERKADPAIRVERSRLSSPWIRHARTQEPTERKSSAALPAYAVALRRPSSGAVRRSF